MGRSKRNNDISPVIIVEELKKKTFSSFLFDIAWREAEREINCFHFYISY